MIRREPPEARAACSRKTEAQTPKDKQKDTGRSWEELVQVNECHRAMEKQVPGDSRQAEDVRRWVGGTRSLGR